MGKVTLYYNCHLLNDHKLFKNDLWIQDGKIIDPMVVEYTCDDAVDCQGATVTAGFIDLKLNGGFGHDFSASDNCQRAVDEVALRLPKYGVTSFCPTVLTSSPEMYHRILPQIRRREGDARVGAGILGIHLDGPFLSKEMPGAHNITYISTFNNGFQSVKDVYGDLENVSLITLAPELPNAIDVIRNLSRWGIKVSLGHSAAPLATAAEAVAAGAQLMTYLFNTVPSFHHRDPGLIGLVAADLPSQHRMYFGLIADRNHTHPAALRMAYKIAPKSLFLVSDGVAALGLGCGEFSLAGKTVVVEGEELRCTLKGTDILSGSVTTLDSCIFNLKKHTDCSLVDALEAATLNPALALGIQEKKGTLDFGTDADFVLINPETLSVRATYIAGQLAYEA